MQQYIHCMVRLCGVHANTHAFTQTQPYFSCMTLLPLVKMTSCITCTALHICIPCNPLLILRYLRVRWGITISHLTIQAALYFNQRWTGWRKKKMSPDWFNPAWFKYVAWKRTRQWRQALGEKQQNVGTFVFKVSIFRTFRDLSLILQTSHHVKNIITKTLSHPWLYFVWSIALLLKSVIFLTEVFSCLSTVLTSVENHNFYRFSLQHNDPTLEE